MARCHMHNAGGERFFLPGCMGGAVYGRDGCTCPTGKGEEQRIYELECEVAELKKQIPPVRGILPKIVNK